MRNPVAPSTRLGLVLSLVCLFVLASPGLADELIDQETLERSRGRYTLSVRGVGEFKVEKIDARGRDKECAVHVESLKRGLREMYGREGAELEVGNKGVISLALSECMSASGKKVVCCKGSGELCSVNVTAVRVF